MSETNQPIDLDMVTKEDLAAMLVAKTNELSATNLSYSKLQKENTTLVHRSMKVYEENALYKAAPELAQQMAIMEFEMKLATRFIASKAFKAANAEQAYVMIKAGAEMGLKPVEAMQALYCVNGAVKMYGDKMVAKITKEGYKIEYQDENGQQVKVRCYHPDTDFDVTELVTINDQIIKKSNAAKFALKNKMRFHGIRLIASFHLPHLFGSLADEFSNDYDEWQETQPKSIAETDDGKQRDRVLNHITNATTYHLLEQVEQLAGDYGFTQEYEAKKNEFLNAQNDQSNA